MAMAINQMPAMMLVIRAAALTFSKREIAPENRKGKINTVVAKKKNKKKVILLTTVSRPKAYVAAKRNGGQMFMPARKPIIKR